MPPTLSPVRLNDADRSERVHTKSTKQQVMTSATTNGVGSRKREAPTSAVASEEEEAERGASPTKKSSSGPLVVTSHITSGKSSAGRPFQEPFLMSPTGRTVVINSKTTTTSKPKGTQVSYLPEGLWLAKERSKKPGAEKKLFYISTSYVSLGISIDVGNAFTKEVEVGCSGVAKVRVLFKGEESHKEGTGPRITVKDIDVDQFDTPDENASFTSNSGGDGDGGGDGGGSGSSGCGGCALMQKLVLRLPYPCRTVEIMILHRALEFVSIFYVQCYSSSIRSSAQSTPVSKPSDRGGRSDRDLRIR